MYNPVVSDPYGASVIPGSRNLPASRRGAYPLVFRLLLGIWLVLFGSLATAMDNPYRLTTEAQLPTRQETLTRFWMAHAEPGEFMGINAVPIRYVALRHPQSQRAILLVNGRTSYNFV